MGKKKRSKQRTDFKKNYQGRVRRGDLTRDFHDGKQDELADAASGERVSGKGDLTRKRTVDGNAEASDNQELIAGRVVTVFGLKSRVVGDDGQTYHCAIRQVLKSLHIEQRNIVVAGDRVRLRAASPQDGMIESVEPRQGIISRTSRGQQHIIAANVDYLLIVTSAAQPNLKPALIDRFLLTAESCEVEPVVVINKIDLVDAGPLQQLVGVYSSMGYQVLMTSAELGTNVAKLRDLVKGKQTAVAGQSGVGKSSLLNAVQPGLGLAVAEVSANNEKGRHTTTTAQLIPLASGGAVFDTPGIRQFQLWDVIAEEVAGYFRDVRPYINDCQFPDCSHTHEEGCAVKHAVADGRIDVRRYESYCYIRAGDVA
jgi:ribosome biogenesis GTPase